MFYIFLFVLVFFFTSVFYHVSSVFLFLRGEIVMIPEARGITGQLLGYDYNDVRNPYGDKMLRKVRKQEGVRSRICLKAKMFLPKKNWHGTKSTPLHI